MILHRTHTHIVWDMKCACTIIDTHFVIILQTRVKRVSEKERGRVKDGTRLCDKNKTQFEENKENNILTVHIFLNFTISKQKQFFWHF